MPRGKRNPVEQPQETQPATGPINPAADGPASPPSAEVTGTDDTPPKKQWVSHLPDPFGRHGIDLGDGRRLQLSRSGKWNQMQIRFVATKEGVDPKPRQEDGDTQWLRAHGWNWRGDTETKAWTVQLLAPDEKELSTEDKARRRIGADKRAEDNFIELAQRIRARNGLPPVSIYAAPDPGQSRG